MPLPANRSLSWAADRNRDPALTQRRYYAETATGYEDQHVDAADEHGVALAHAVSYLRWLRSESVLDTGCGTGRALRFVAEALPGVAVRGNDPSPDLLRVAVDRFGVSPEVLDEVPSDPLPYPDGSFDAVIATGVMHHAARPERIVSEMLRVARQAIFISDCNIYGMGAPAGRLINLLLARLGLLRTMNRLRRGGHEWFYTPGDGVAWSYSVFDSYRTIAAACSEVLVIPTASNRATAGAAPLLTSSHCLLCGFKQPFAAGPPRTVTALTCGDSP